MGSNGEYAYLNSDEKVEMVRQVKSLAPDKLLLAGSGCEGEVLWEICWVLEPHAKSYNHQQSR